LKNAILRPLIFLLCAVLFFIAGHISSSRSERAEMLQSFASKIERALKEREIKLNNLLNEELENADQLKDFNTSDQDNDSDFPVFIYRHDSLLHWHSSSVEIVNSINDYEDGSQFVKLKNGFYLLIKKSKGEWSAIGLVPVYSSFEIENKYLENRFLIRHIPSTVQLRLMGEENSLAIHDQSGAELFFITQDISAEPASDMFSFLLFVCSLISMGIFAHRFSKFLANHYPPSIAFLFLIILLTGLRLIMIVYKLPEAFYSLKLFSPTLYASSFFSGSLGDLLLNTLVITWLTSFFYSTISIALISKGSLIRKTTYAAIAFLLMLLFAQLSYTIIRSLVIDSSIPLDISYFLDLTSYSFVALLVICFLLFSNYLITTKLISQITSGEKHIRLLVASSLLSLIPVAGCIFLKTGLVYQWEVAGFVYLFIAVLVLLKRVSIPERSFLGLLVLLGLFALASSVALFRFNYQKEHQKRIVYAGKIVSDSDPLTEYLFRDIEQRIANDQFVINYFSSPMLSGKKINERVNILYFSGYLSRFDIKIHKYNLYGEALDGNDSRPVEQIREEIGKYATPTSNQNLFYISKPDQSTSYIGIISIIVEEGPLGTLVVEMIPKVYRQSNVYPELLLEEAIKPNENEEQYSYAIYLNEKLVSSKGEYPLRYDPTLEENLINKNFYYFDKGNHDHLVLKYDHSKRVIVSIEEPSWLKPLALFSYLFCLFLVFYAIVMIVRFVSRISKAGFQLQKFERMNLRDRIQFSLIAIIVFSFITIGYVTIRFFSGENKSYHEDRLLRKQQSVLQSIGYILREEEPFSPDSITTRNIQDLMSLHIAELADVHSMDINLYDTNGLLMLSSQPVIFEKGLQGERMNPVAFSKLREHGQRWIQQEKTGTLEYLSVYVPVKNREEQTVAYLNLPYFATQKDLKKSISSFMVTLVNVYVLLLMIAAFIAFGISRSITKSLATIGDMMKMVQLGKKNQAIEVKTDDEVGRLVNEYNKMLKELERSAYKLAQTERESAWREMAKQVAHEIKNPLTPMKLSIQYLQRAINDNHPNVKELAQNVAVTLVEQIDNLSQIASEFSSFAQMQHANHENVNLNEVINSVVRLFLENSNVDFKVNLPDRNAFVFSDKNAMIRVFNNLIKNAVQATDETENPKIEISLYQKNDRYRIEIKDNGVGITEYQKTQVFVPQFTTKSSGTGLGLAITKKIIENSNGTIWFESVAGSGATFIIEVPVLIA